jgi:hypothetical protein
MSLLPRRLVLPIIASAIFSLVLVHLVYQRSNIVGYLDTFKSGHASPTINGDEQWETQASSPTSRP